MNEKFMNGLLSFAGKMQSNKVLSAVKDGFIDIMPITIVGSFCTLFQYVLTTPQPGGISLANIKGLDGLQVLNPIWSHANYGCMNFLAVLICFMVAFHYADGLGHANDKTGPAVALASFVTLITTSTTATAPESGEVVTVNGVVASSYTNASGLFVAIICGILVPILYYKLIDSGKLAIKLPDSVPPNVAASFTVLFPTVITIFVVAIVGFCLESFLGLTAFQLIAKIMSPVEAIMTGLPGYLVVVLIMMLLWWFGIHGPNVMSAVTTPFMTRMWTINDAIYQATGTTKLGTSAVVDGVEESYHIISTPFNSAFFSHTGSGITGGLIIAILLFSKRDDFKAIAKLAIPCGIFNINEPIIFGIPMVMNPILGIPFFLAPVVSVIIGYVLTVIGICPVFVINAPWTTPTGILGFLASGANFMGGLCQLIAFASTILIYTPFVIACNSQTAEA